MTLPNISKFDLQEVSLMPNGDAAVGGRIEESTIDEWYSIMGFVVPLTGWIGNYVYLGKFFLRITGKHLKK